LGKCEEQAVLNTPKSTILNIITKMILDDTVTVLSRLNEALDEMDLSMADDEILRKSLRDWRNRFGRWRKGLLRQRASLAYVRRVLGLYSTSSSSQFGAGKSSSTPSRQNTENELLSLEDELEATQKRIDGTFQALMSTMSIIESQEAIAQAETVSKLTYLAFFFIPPTFVTGIFGMNIVASYFPSLLIS
jgi:Mg2+ and Co2+ transporter CorA